MNGDGTEGASSEGVTLAQPYEDTGKCQACGCQTYNNAFWIDKSKLPEGARPLGAAFLQSDVVLCIDCYAAGLLYAARRMVAERDTQQQETTDTADALGKLQDFACAISNAVWGGELAWDGESGLSTLTTVVCARLKQREELIQLVLEILDDVKHGRHIDYMANLVEEWVPRAKSTLDMVIVKTTTPEKKS